MINDNIRQYGRTKELSIEQLQKGFEEDVFRYVQIALLFGCRAVDKAHKRSDYDIALLMRDDLADEWGIVSRAWDDVGRTFGLSEIDYDIVDLSRMTEAMKSTIKDGYFVLKGSADDVSSILG